MILFIAASQRMWSLQQLHMILVGEKTLISSYSSSGLLLQQQLKSNDSALDNLLKELPESLLRQYEYEDISVRAGLHLMHSDFFKVTFSIF